MCTDFAIFNSPAAGRLDRFGRPHKARRSATVYMTLTLLVTRPVPQRIRLVNVCNLTSISTQTAPAPGFPATYV